MDQRNLDWFAARLAIAVYDINSEHRMGHITELREAMKDVPGGKDLIMRYEDGGTTQIYKIGEDELRFLGSCTVSADDLLTALEDKKKDQRLPTQSQQLKRSQA